MPGAHYAAIFLRWPADHFVFVSVALLANEVRMKHVIVVVGLALIVGVAVLLAAHGVAQVAPGGGPLFRSAALSPLTAPSSIRTR